MRVLELFAGSRSIGKVAEARGHEVFSVDINNFDGIDLVKDVDELLMEDIPFCPDMVWSGTPCTTYSLAAGSHHRHPNFKPKTDFALKCDRMNIKVNHFINEWLNVNPDLIYYIENPRAMLRKMYFMQGIPRVTVWYCQYGDFRAKPTDIFSNNIGNPLFNPTGWFPRAECKNYKYDKDGNVINKHCNHDPSMRGSNVRKLQAEGKNVKIGGTAAQKGNYERSIYPEELCIEIIKSTENKLK